MDENTQQQPDKTKYQWQNKTFSRIRATHTKSKRVFEFNSQYEAAQHLNVHASAVAQVLSGKSKTAGGYTFERI